MEANTNPNAALDFIRAERDTAHEQIAAAWQLHVERVTEQLETGWKDHVARALEDRFAALEVSMGSEIDRRVVAHAAEVERRAAEQVAEVEAHARRRMSERLNQVCRRLDQAEDIQAWTAALLDGAHAFAPKVVLFSALNGELKYEGHRAPAESGFNAEGFLGPISAVPAFAGVVETQDTVISESSERELSSGLAAVLGVPPECRVCLLPVVVGRGGPERKVSAILYAQPGDTPLDVNVLELLAAAAGATLECRFQRSAPAPLPGLVDIAPAGPEVEEAAPALLNGADRDAHARAQRFARVRVAEMRLYQPQAVRKGRDERRIYDLLRAEMDRSREQYRDEFMGNPSMIDYLHQEFVHTLANDDPSLLGPEYPGPLAA